MYTKEQAQKRMNYPYMWLVIAAVFLTPAVNLVTEYASLPMKKELVLALGLFCLGVVILLTLIWVADLRRDVENARLRYERTIDLLLEQRGEMGLALVRSVQEIEKPTELQLKRASIFAAANFATTMEAVSAVQRKAHADRATGVANTVESADAKFAEARKGYWDFIYGLREFGQAHPSYGWAHGITSWTDSLPKPEEPASL